jgi:uncharacterized metal-binding protein YceD (DUF177 family)
VQPEFSRPLSPGAVGAAGRTETLTASPAECAALAARFNILGIGRVGAVLQLASEPAGAVLAEGRITAEVTQACSVSLEPVVQLVDEPVAFRLLPSGQPAEEDPDEIDAIETVNGVADLGEAVAEQLALALDPFPRHPEAELPPEANDAAAGAFAALASLKRPG